MATIKEFESADIGTIKVVKNKRSKRIKLAFDNQGTVRVTIPHWLPFQSGKNYALTQHQWIQSHRPDVMRFKDGDIVGRKDRLVIRSGVTFAVRLTSGGVTVTTPSETKLDEPAISKKIVDACYRSLKRQAESILAERMNYFEGAMGTKGTKVRVGRTHSRWGSCSSTGTISFSIFIAQLDDALIDYIIAHELAHTYHMDHSKAFWEKVETAIPDYKQYRSELKTHDLRLKLKSPHQA